MDKPRRSSFRDRIKDTARSALDLVKQNRAVIQPVDDEPEAPAEASSAMPTMKEIQETINRNMEHAANIKLSLESLKKSIERKARSGKWGDEWKDADLEEIYEIISDIQEDLEKPVPIPLDVHKLDSTAEMLIDALKNIGEHLSPKDYIRALDDLASVIATQRRSERARDVQLGSLALLLYLLEWKSQVLETRMDALADRQEAINKEIRRRQRRDLPTQELTAQSNDIETELTLMDNQLMQMDDEKSAIETKIATLKNDNSDVSTQTLREILDDINKELVQKREDARKQIKQAEGKAIEHLVSSKEELEKTLNDMPVSTPESEQDAARAISRTKSNKNTRYRDKRNLMDEDDLDNQDQDEDDSELEA